MAFKKFRRKPGFGSPPTTDQIEQAKENYFNNGGKVKLIIIDDKNYKDFIDLPIGNFESADHFLIGSHL